MRSQQILDALGMGCKLTLAELLNPSDPLYRFSFGILLCHCVGCLFLLKLVQIVEEESML